MIVLGNCTISLLFIVFFFFNDTATTEIYTLSLHDALPISGPPPRLTRALPRPPAAGRADPGRRAGRAAAVRSRSGPAGSAPARRWRPTPPGRGGPRPRGRTRRPARRRAGTTRRRRRRHARR